MCPSSPRHRLMSLLMSSISVPLGRETRSSQRPPTLGRGCLDRASTAEDQRGGSGRRDSGVGDTLAHDRQVHRSTECQQDGGPSPATSKAKDSKTAKDPPWFRYQRTPLTAASSSHSTRT